MVGERVEGFKAGYGFGILKPRGSAVVGSHKELHPAMTNWLMLSAWIRPEGGYKELRISVADKGKKITHWHTLGTIETIGYAHTKRFEVFEEKDFYTVTFPVGYFQILEPPTPRLEMKTPFKKIDCVFTPGVVVRMRRTEVYRVPKEYPPPKR